MKQQSGWTGLSEHQSASCSTLLQGWSETDKAASDYPETSTWPHADPLGLYEPPSTVKRSGQGETSRDPYGQWDSQPDFGTGVV